MAKMSKKVQVDLSDENIAHLDEIAGKLRRNRNNYKLGVATVIAEIIDGILASRPDLLHEFFGDDANSLPVAAEHPAEYETKRPKSARRRQAG